GLFSACDMGYALVGSVFSFGVVKFGIIPATISSYVIIREEELKDRDLMLTTRLFTAQMAAQYGLINQYFNTVKAMDEYVENIITQLKENSPHALTQCKALIAHVSSTPDLDQLLPYTARMIAEARISEEGQEGMAAFLGK